MRTKLLIIASSIGMLGWGTVLPYQYAYAANTRDWGALIAALASTQMPPTAMRRVPAPRLAVMRTTTTWRATMTTQLTAAARPMAASSMTHRLDKMAGRGLLQRRPDPTNRTRTLVSLTTDGWALFSAAVRESNVVESDTLRGLSSSERHELARLLEIVINGLDDVDA